MLNSMKKEEMTKEQLKAFEEKMTKNEQKLREFQERKEKEIKHQQKVAEMKKFEIEKALHENEKQIKEITAQREQIDKDIDYLTHVCAELELAQVKKGEEQELADIKRKLQF